jgi:hypothetical protein
MSDSLQEPKAQGAYEGHNFSLEIKHGLTELTNLGKDLIQRRSVRGEYYEWRGPYLR